MKKQEKIKFIIDSLEKCYPKTPIPLDHYSPYTLLLSVLLSAQTTDKKVNQVTPALFQRADTPYLVTQMNWEEIKEYIKEIGLSTTKAKNILKLSEMLIEKHEGKVPQTYEELESLPGVGHKTASVVMSQAFGFHAFPVDTHIHRLMWRWGLSNGKNVMQTEKDAKRLFPKHLWNKLHLQIIYYGREYSPARNMKLTKDFITYSIGRKEVLKNPKKKAKD